MGGSYEPPNIFILAQMGLPVNVRYGILTEICVLHNLNLASLYNIASCKRENRMVIYSHKRKAPFEKKDFLPPFFLKEEART